MEFPGSAQSPLSVRIPLQEPQHFDPWVLSDSVANAVYSDPEQLFQALSDVFTLRNKRSLGFDHQGIKDLLTSFVRQEVDFGAVYASVRRAWEQNYVGEDEFLSRLSSIDGEEQKDEQARQSSLSDGAIDLQRIRPRRVWDLYANRVVPYHCCRLIDPSSISRSSTISLAVSHSRTDDETPVLTPINGREWPVPLPSNVDLDAIRTELLNHGAEYAWLDVLCLRQPGSDTMKEELRKAEWAIDLPTIGSVFQRHGNVMWYMNGLGRALENTGWEHPQHWLKRAWTLQEIGRENAHSQIIIGGVPEDVSDPLDVTSLETGQTLRDRLAPLLRLHSLMDGGVRPRAFVVAANAIRGQFSSNPVDKVVGILTLLKPQTLPLYDGSVSEEDAWSRSIDHLDETIWAYLLVEIGVSGDQGVAWRPSWAQLMSRDIPEPDCYEGPIRIKVGRVYPDGSCDVEALTITARLVSVTPAPERDGEWGVWECDLESEPRQVEMEFMIDSPELAPGAYAFRKLWRKMGRLRKGRRQVSKTRDRVSA